MMEEVVRELQSIIDLPLQIDTSIFRPWNGRCVLTTVSLLINSRQWKAKEVMEAVFPLVEAVWRCCCRSGA